MLNVSDDFKNSFLNSEKQLKLTFSNGVIIENEDIASETMVLEQTLCDEESLRFGKVCASSFEVKIVAGSASYVGLTLVPTLTADSNSINLGRFKVYSDKKTSNKLFRQIIAYDAIYELSNTNYADWYNNLHFPMSLQALRNAFFAYVGINQKSVVLPNDGMIVEKTVQSSVISGLNILQAICEINGCFGRINNDGLFEYVFISKDEAELYPSDNLYPDNTLFPIGLTKITASEYYQGTLQYEDFKVQKISELQIRLEENDIGVIVGTEGNRYVIEDNFLVYGKSTESLRPVANNILEKISSIGIYTPFSVNVQGRPWMELGDYISISGSIDVVTAPILHRKITGINNLKDAWDAKGEEYISDDINGLTYDVMMLKGKANILERTIEHTQSTILNIEENLQSQIEQTDEYIRTEVSSLQTQIDGNITTYTGEEVPTLNNYPYTEWVESGDNLKRHVGSIYYTNDGDAYRFTYNDDTNTYAWIQITNADLQQALADSQLALGIANGLSDDLANNYSTTVQMNSVIEQTAQSITSTVSQQILNTRNELSSEISQSAGEIELSVSQTYETKSSAGSNYTTLQAQITANTNGISQRVVKGDVVSEINQSADTITLKSDRLVVESTNLSISADGTITATNASLSGSVTANSGKIGAFTIGSKGLTSGSTGTLSAPYGVYVGTDGISCGSTNASFKVDSSGVLTIENSSGSITLGSSSVGRMILDKDGISFGGSSLDVKITKSQLSVYNNYIDRDKLHCGTTTTFTELSSSNLIMQGVSSSYRSTYSYSGIDVTASQNFSIHSTNAGVSITGNNTVSISANTKVNIANRYGSGYGLPTLSFFGVTGSTQITVANATSSTVQTQLNALINALKSYGLIK